MAHRISIQNGKAEFAYVGQDPWHALGEKQPRHLTAREAVAKVLPWTVSTRPVRFQSAEDGAFDTGAGNVRVIVRDDTHTCLGVATTSYQPIQNAQAADVIDALVAEGAECVETIGALDDGARCFSLVALDKTGFEVRKGDLVQSYFLLRWGHDGRTPLSGKLTNIRVCCHNTLTAAGRAYAFDVHHTANAKLRIADAQEALGLARKVAAKTQEQYQALAGAALAPQRAVDYFAGVFPAPAETVGTGDARLVSEKLARWNAVQARLLSLYSGEGKGALVAGPTAWGAYNAVTEYLDHVYPVLQSGKVSADRQESVLFGAYADVRDGAFASALALVG